MVYSTDMFQPAIQMQYHPYYSNPIIPPVPMVSVPAPQSPGSYSSSSEGSSSPRSPNKVTKRTLTSPENATHICTICGKGFGRVWNWKAHQDTHDPKRRKDFSCHCGKQFVRKNDLERHNTSKHLKVKEFSCSMCGREFARKDTLQRHESDGCPHRQHQQGRSRNQPATQASYSQDTLDPSAFVNYGDSFPNGLPQAQDTTPRTMLASQYTQSAGTFYPNGGSYFPYPQAQLFAHPHGNGYPYGNSGM